MLKRLGQSIPSSSTQQSQPVCKFQQHWLKLYPWLTTGTSDKGVTWMICKLCVKHKKHNALTDEGTSNFRTSTLTRHAACGDHKAAVLAERMKGQLQEALDKAPSEKEGAVVIELKAVYWLAKENLPLHKLVRKLHETVGKSQAPKCGETECKQGYHIHL